LEDLKLYTFYETKTMKIIEKVIDQYALKTAERKIFTALSLSADEKMECSPTAGEIAAMCGISGSGVRRAIRSLEKKGLVKREARYHEDEPTARAANKYILRFEA
jgi:DNA-binding MarR family transcriptional regulator